MNLLIWIFCGMMFGVIFARFAFTAERAIAQIILGMVTFMFGGYVATKLIKDTPATNINPATFSPGGLFVATFVGVFLFLLIYIVVL